MNEKGLGWAGTFFLIISVGIVVLLWNYFTRPDYSKPWWQGTGTQRLCKVPYYDNSECFTAPVSTDGQNITRIGLPDGKSFDGIESTTCYKAASSEPIERFCEIYVNDNRWDVIPLFDK